MKIIEYNHTYAAKVADMWNKSNSNWGNDDELKTEQDVIDAESNSGNIKLFIAIDNDEVVGYCSISEYRQDEGASYLPLLNVRPDYHGKKVGKALILRTLEEAIKAKWPRFDLYTWSGNTKAMPLYKRCGFFWERRNNTNHLMNFIPYIYHTEAFNDYVNAIDFYQDSKREITMDYDGVDENGFDIYYYDFSNDKTSLSLGFEKTGRGLVYIDNPDYQIRLTIDQHKQIFNTSNKAKLHILNKSLKSLMIDIQGVVNKNVVTNYFESVSVETSQDIYIPFTIEETNKNQDLGKTHPCLEINLSINGKSMNLKCGISTKPPIDLSLKTIEMIHVKDKSYDAYLDIENNLSKEQEFSIHLPKSNINFESDIQVALKPGEKRSVKVPYSIQNFGFYCENAVVKYDDLLYKKEVKAMFKGSEDSFVSNLDKHILIASGNSLMTFEKAGHNIYYSNSNEIFNNIMFMPPKIGLPYSLEFNNIEPKLEIVSDTKIILTFISETFKDIVLNIHILNQFGLLKVNYELLNNGEEKELSLSIPVVIYLENSSVPYQSRILKIDDYAGYSYNVDISKIDENWIYNHEVKQGFSWPDDIKVKAADWHLNFEVEGLKLKKNERYQTKSFDVSYQHANVKEFRKYVNFHEEKQEFGFLELNINEMNPFIEEDAKVKLINHRKAQVEGTISNNNNCYNITEPFRTKAGLQSFKIELADHIIEEKRYLFQPKGKVSMNEENGIYTVNNGLLIYKADIKHSDSVFSLVFDNHEWLDSNYPIPKERSWWASFVGGIVQRVAGIQDIVAINEERKIEFVEVKDNFNNQWSGLRITTIYSKDPVIKGVSVENYILTMPGVPLLYMFANVINNSGALILNKHMFRRYTFNFDDAKGTVRYKLKNRIYKVVDQGLETTVDKLLVIESSRKYNLAVYNNHSKMFMDSQKDFIILNSEKKMIVPDREVRHYQGDFLLFTKEDLKKDDLCLFDCISFDVDNN